MIILKWNKIRIIVTIFIHNGEISENAGLATVGPANCFQEWGPCCCCLTRMVVGAFVDLIDDNTSYIWVWVCLGARARNHCKPTTYRPRVQWNPGYPALTLLNQENISSDSFPVFDGLDGNINPLKTIQKRNRPPAAAAAAHLRLFWRTRRASKIWGEDYFYVFESPIISNAGSQEHRGGSLSTRAWICKVLREECLYQHLPEEQGIEAQSIPCPITQKETILPINSLASRHEPSWKSGSVVVRRQQPYWPRGLKIPTGRFSYRDWSGQSLTRSIGSFPAHIGSSADKPGINAGANE